MLQKNKRKNNNNDTFSQIQQTKIEVDKNRILIIGFSNCGKTNLKNHILHQKQEPIFTITKCLNQYPNIKAQTSDEIQPVNEYENSTAVFDDMLTTKQESEIDLFFTRGIHNNIDIYYISQSYFRLLENTIRNSIKKIILVKQTLRDIILIFHDIAGLDMNLEEWKEICRNAWESEYAFLQIDRFAKVGEGRYTIRNCNKNNYIECTPETKPF